MSWSSLHASQHCSHTSDSVHHWHWSTPCVSDEGSLDCNLILCFNQNCCSNFHWTFPDPQQFSFSKNSGNETSNRLQGYIHSNLTICNFHNYKLRILNLQFSSIVKTPTQLHRNLNPTVVGGWTRKWLGKPPNPHKLHVWYISAVPGTILTKL